MVDSEGFAPSALLAELEAEAASHTETAGGGFVPLPSVLPIADIVVHPALFQCRPLSEQHVVEMAKAVLAGDVLPPLLVAQVGGRAVLLDGHHRLEALKLAKAEMVSVALFAGTLQEAVLAACAANRKTKLPMSPAERADAAWRYVLLGVGSKAGVSQATGVAARTVANMRTVKGKLGEEAYGIQSWAKAILTAHNSNPADMTDEGREEWLEATAQRHANTLAKAFGPTLSKNPEVTARALSIHLGRKLPDVVRELRDYLPDETEGDY